MTLKLHHTCQLDYAYTYIHKEIGMRRFIVEPEISLWALAQGATPYLIRH